MSSDLKPCPFCGTNAFVYREMTRVKVICRRARCTAHRAAAFDSEQDAIDSWNQRADDWIPVASGEMPPFDKSLIITARQNNAVHVVDAVFYRRAVPFDGNGDPVTGVFGETDAEVMATMSQPHFSTWDGLLFREGEILAWRLLPPPYVPTNPYLPDGYAEQVDTPENLF